MVAVDAKAIYLLGDIFDFWFEYHRVAPQGFVRVLGRLANLTDRGVEVVFITGNHDMWCLDYLTRECGVKVVHKPTIVNIEGQNIHLAHGDNLNIQGKPMLRAMNGFFRSTVARFIFSWLIHPDLAMKFGRWWSGKSRKSHKGDNITPESLNFLVEYARGHKAANPNVEGYIFGHMHYPHIHDDKELRVLFLSDWSGKEATYGVIDSLGNAQLKTFAIDETIS
jgi:UDP-2,3-diacylglucosamine hydrolase